ncbi:universal stress protein, partial [Sphingorhabdus sp.]|uniref:universal stress protein n=1 Tax=Sphingorhabdus sp. TaxID=1902408 RepID=UPI0035B42B09
MKSVLVHVQDDAGLQSRLQAALAIARASKGHLSCIHITPINAYVAYDQFGGVFVMGQIMKAIGEREDEIRGTTEAQLSREDVPWDYAQATGDPTRILVSRAALFDLLVVSRSENKVTSADPSMAMLGDLLEASRTPILVHPTDHSDYDPLGPAVIAWNGSFEASNALRQAIPLLAMACDVHLLSVEEKTDKENLIPSLAASAYLSRHGIASQLHEITAGSEPIEKVLVAQAIALEASTLVMGAYGHSR